MSTVTMLSQIHLRTKRLQLLSDAKSLKIYEEVQEKLKKSSKTRVSHPCFIQIKEITNGKTSLGKQNNIVTISFEKKDVTLLDMVNTLAYLQSNIGEKNVLLMKPCTFCDWSVVHDVTDEHVLVKMPQSDLEKIQYGWGCYIDVHHATRKHFQSMSYYRIVSTWENCDETIFRHVLIAFYEMIGRSRKAHIVPDIDQASIDVIRKLPKLLSKFGMEKKRYAWESYFLQDYLNPNNSFLKSLMAFIIPWDTCARKRISISCDKFMVQYIKESPYVPPVLKEFAMQHGKHVNKKDEGTRYTLSSYGKDMYCHFYNCLLSDFISPKHALQLFLSVQYDGGTFYTGCKRRCGSHSNSKVNDNKLSTMEEYFSDRDIYPGVHYKQNGKCHLARFLLLCQMRTEFKKEDWSCYSAKDYIRLKQADYMWCFVKDSLSNNAQMEHVVPLPRSGQKKDYKDCNVPISQSFPVLKITKGIKKQLDEVNVDNYYNIYD